MTTNLTNLTGATNFYDVAVFIGQETGYIFFSGFLLVIFFILIMGFRKTGAEWADCIGFACLINFVFAMILSYIKLVPSTLMFPFLFGFVIYGFYVWISR